MNLNTGEVDVVDLDLDEILRITVGEDRGFAAFRQGQDLGIMELRWDGRGYSFADTYRNFPLSVTEIRDLDLWGDSLFVTTSSGVIGNDYIRANLKEPATWQLLTPERDDIIQYHVDSTGHYYLVPNYLYYRIADEWTVHSNVIGGALHHLMRRWNGDFVISFSNYLQVVNSSGHVLSSPRAAGYVLAYTDGQGNDEGYAIIRDHGLARFNHQARSWTSLAPNTMAGCTEARHG